MKGDDSLKEMWEQQESFMQLLKEKRGFPKFPVDISTKHGQKLLKEIRNHLIEELFEAGQHLRNSKTHRITELPEVDRDAYLEELVDAQHLLFELVIASGFSLEQYVQSYMLKGRVNDARIRGDY